MGKVSLVVELLRDISKPDCFRQCTCGDMHEEHCTNRDLPVPRECWKCKFYFGYLERLEAEKQYKRRFEKNDV